MIPLSHMKKEPGKAPFRSIFATASQPRSKRQIGPSGESATGRSRMPRNASRASARPASRNASRASAYPASAERLAGSRLAGSFAPGQRIPAPALRQGRAPGRRRRLAMGLLTAPRPAARPSTRRRRARTEAACGGACTPTPLRQPGSGSSSCSRSSRSRCTRGT